MAEALGSVLLQPLCAMVPVPRQEDWGLFDAVGTILQLDGEFLFAEQSFFIQFKAPSAKPMRYSGKRLDALLNRELAFLVGRVDLRRSEIEVFDAGEVLAHPNARTVKSIELRLGKGRLRVSSEELVGFLSKPILRWRLPDMLDAGFRLQAYSVLGAWLELDGERRSLYRLGIIEPSEWETNQLPRKWGGFQMFRMGGDGRLPRELAPAIRLIAALAGDNVELIESARTLVEWARKHGVDADPGGILLGFTAFAEARHRFEKVRERFPAATDALTFVVQARGPDWLEFWLYPGLGKVKCGNAVELAQQGFIVGLDPVTNVPTTIAPGDEWLRERNLELLAEDDGVFLLKKLE